MHGHAFDSVTNRPVAGATITLENESYERTFYTDVNGYYLVEVGIASLMSVTADGYAPICYDDFDFYGMMTVNFDLKPEVKGDINQDDNVTLADAVLVFQILTGTSSLKACKKMDVNGDDTIGIEEVIFVLKKLAEL